MSTRNDLIELLKKLNQAALLPFLEELDSKECDQLLVQLKNVDLHFLRYAKDSSEELIAPPPSSIRVEEIQHYSQLGKKLLSEGKAAALVVAGGQGTRLQFNGPKGMFPISSGEGKTLFQLLAEKVKKASDECGRSLPLVLMTSPENDAITKDYFRSNCNFGLDENSLHFFSQGELPLLTGKAELFFSSRGKLAMGPDGNGSSLPLLWSSGLGEILEAQKVEQLTYNLIDNPLSDPFDPLLIGWNAQQKSDVTVKCIKRENPEEKVGVIVRLNGKIAVKEYSEIPLQIRCSLNDFPLANISLFCFSLQFTKSLNINCLPFHKALKASPHYELGGNQLPAAAPAYLKYERFIFDVLNQANRVELLLYPREKCFAPLKDKASIALVQAALENNP